MRIPHLAQRIAPNGTRDLITAAAVIGAFIVATVAIAILEAEPFGIEDASPVYLVAVVAAGALAGTLPALVTAVAAFLLYDILFTEPRLSFAVSDPREVLDLVLLLFVGLVVGRLAAVQHARAEEAAERAAEANTLFALSRALATATSTAEAAPDIADRVRETAGLERVWVVAGTGVSEHVLADTGSGAGGGIPRAAGGTPPPHPSLTSNLVRTPGDEPARWVRTHAATRSGTTLSGIGEHPQYRVRIEVGGIQLGTIIAVRDRELGDPSRSETRVLALAADQIAVSLRRDQLRQAATDLEIAHQTDALKTALIDSVSHDLRTPLASIRATAGGLADPDVSWTDEARRSAAHVIDTEATRLDRLVSGLLDLSKIASGGLHPDLEPHELWSVVEPAVERLRPSLGKRAIQVDVPDSLPPVLADAVLLDIVVTNLLDNVGAHSRSDAPVAIHADVDDGMVRLVVEDGGPGVPGDALGSLFERFRRSPSRSEGSRRGLGIGLSVVRGVGRRDVRPGERGPEPARRPGSVGPAPPRACSGRDRAMSARILLVEDDAATRTAVAANLEAHGFRVTTSDDVAGALRAWDAERPDLILLDLGLPDLDGSAVVRHVRRDATTPILILSARADERVKVATLEAGADDYVTKPFGMDELRARIGAVLRRAAGPAADATGVVRLGPDRDGHRRADA